jgi:hypothetical protein
MYPVREAAEVALRVLRQPGFAQLGKDRTKVFAQRLAESRKYARAHKLTPRRFILAANGGLAGKPATRTANLGARRK